MPTDDGRERGRDIARRVLARWTPPDHFFHFREGGHVAACRHHLERSVFAHLDIRSFFNSVTRSKVHRALRRIGIQHKEAWDIAQDSTVPTGPRRRVVPFGFVQSMVLASAALDQSLLGRAFQHAAALGIRVSVYVDDIVLSGRDDDLMKATMDAFGRAAAASGYWFNEDKVEGPAVEIEAFNILLSSAGMRVSDERMAQFRAAAVAGDPQVADAVVRYVRTVNVAQSAGLADMVSALS